MKTIRKTLIILLSALLVALCGYQAGYYYQRSKPIVVQIPESVVKHNNFQFMTSDTVFCYLGYSHQSNDVEVWGAVRSVICSHKSADLKEPDACRILSEEILESHDLEVVIHKIRFLYVRGCFVDYTKYETMDGRLQLHRGYSEWYDILSLMKENSKPDFKIVNLMTGGKTSTM